jgi:capsular polysaccharide biosynthesis protein
LKDWADAPTLFRAVRRRWPLVVLIVMAAGAAGYLLSSGRPPVYEAKTSLLVGEPLATSSVSKDDLDVGERLAATYADLVRREPVMQGVVGALRLDTSWQKLAKGVHVQQSTANPRVIDITVTAASPASARAITAEIDRRLVAFSPTPAQDQAHTFVGRLLDRLQQNIAGQQRTIDNLHAQLAVTSASDQLTLRAQISRLEQLLVNSEATYSNLLAVSGNGQDTNHVEILEPAQASTEPVRSNVPLKASLVGALGLLVGIGLAYALESGRQSRRGPTGTTAPGRALEPTGNSERQLLLPTSVKSVGAAVRASDDAPANGGNSTGTGSDRGSRS